jgi:hypothetical protein
MQIVPSAAAVPPKVEVAGRALIAASLVELVV